MVSTGTGKQLPLIQSIFFCCRICFLGIVKHLTFVTKKAGVGEEQNRSILVKIMEKPQEPQTAKNNIRNNLSKVG